MKITRALFVIGCITFMSIDAYAQVVWLSTSATQVDKDTQNPYVAIDASASAEPFVARNAIPIEGLTAIDPDGNAATLENILVGKVRSSADLKLAKAGTYKIGIEAHSVSVSYRLPPDSPNAPPTRASNGMVRKQLTMEEYKSFKLPNDATQARITRNLRRVATYVTYDRPSNGVLKSDNASGVGLELIPMTHPNDMFPDQKASFRLLLNGKPLPDFALTVMPAGQQYRGVRKEIGATSDAQGLVSFTLPEGGRYWLSAAYPVRGGQGSQSTANADAAPTYTDAYTYGMAIEVLY